MVNKDVYILECGEGGALGSIDSYSTGMIVYSKI